MELNHVFRYTSVTKNCLDFFVFVFNITYLYTSEVRINPKSRINYLKDKLFER